MSASLKIRTYSFDLSTRFLSPKEQVKFDDFISRHNLEPNIWEVFGSLFTSPLKYTQPYVLRAYRNNNLVGATVLIRCNHYGKSLFQNRLLADLIDFLKIPFYLWIRLGCSMDMMSNPGFVSDHLNEKEVRAAMVQYLAENTLLTIINDYSSHHALYPDASTLPALPHALVETESLTSINDYLINFKNIKKKIKRFEKKGGAYTLQNGHLNEEQIAGLEYCFVSTAGQSVFYMPYQDLYLNAAIHTSRTEINSVHYFIAWLEDAFIGYQAALKSGKTLSGLHGAFDRTRRTTFHAYDILFVKMTEFAIEHKLDRIDFGAVLNQTKLRMVNHTIDTSYYLLSKSVIVRRLFKSFLKITKVQGREQMQFRE